MPNLTPTTFITTTSDMMILTTAASDAATAAAVALHRETNPVCLNEAERDYLVIYFPQHLPRPRSAAAQAHLIPKQLLTVICRANADRSCQCCRRKFRRRVAVRHFCYRHRLCHSCLTLSDILTTCKQRVKIDLPS